MRHFREYLDARWDAGCRVCVGLDSELARIPACVEGRNDEDRIFNFNRPIIEANADIVLAFKPNSAFYEAEGLAGMSALKRTMEFLHEFAPRVPIIDDGKRGDIGNTNRGYVKSIFEWLGFDAVTVQPYCGIGALAPFLAKENRTAIIMCRTSNPESNEFQTLEVDGVPLYQIVARNVAEKWNKNGNCGLVMGATFPDEMVRVREHAGDITFLVPGLGTQAKAAGMSEDALRKMVRFAVNRMGRGAIFNTSSSNIFASNGPDFAEASRAETLRTQQFIDDSLAGQAD